MRAKHSLLLSFALFMPLALTAATSHAHPGGLDQHGGHSDRRSGEYHCHRDPCLSAQQKQQQAEQEALQQERDFSTLYDRRDWPHWDDSNKNCRDTRAEVLIVSSKTAVTFRDSRHCTVDSGEWLDPYSGETFYLAKHLDIDHLVPLKHAHGHGGHRWPASKRHQFANDPTNLVPVNASLNRAKGSSSPDQWLPPNHHYWCEYGQRWQEIKTRYQLMITTPEQQALDQLAQSCVGPEALPTPMPTAVISATP